MAVHLAGLRPAVIIHLAAETHAERSIDDPGKFVHTNFIGTYNLLAAALYPWHGLGTAERHAFRFHHVSTDELFGSMGTVGRFDEESPYDPRSPCSASRAATDHLVRHAFRYAIDAAKIRGELGWRPGETFESGIHRTVR